MPKAPTINAPAPPPTTDQARVDAETADAFLKRQGRQATFVSNAAGRDQGGIGTKTLLGQI